MYCKMILRTSWRSGSSTVSICPMEDGVVADGGNAGLNKCSVIVWAPKQNPSADLRMISIPRTHPETARTHFECQFDRQHNILFRS